MFALATVVGLLGLIFVVGNQHQFMRVLVGIILMAAAALIVWLARAKAPERTIIQKVDLTGDVRPEQLKCQSCGASLDDKSIEMREGAIIVKCPYCGTSYQMEEAPKW